MIESCAIARRLLPLEASAGDLLIEQVFPTLSPLPPGVRLGRRSHTTRKLRRWQTVAALRFVGRTGCKNVKMADQFITAEHFIQAKQFMDTRIRIACITTS
jgi:hypothetical protein